MFFCFLREKRERGLTRLFVVLFWLNADWICEIMTFPCARFVSRFQIARLNLHVLMSPTILHLASDGEGISGCRQCHEAGMGVVDHWQCK